MDQHDAKRCCGHRGDGVGTEQEQSSPGCHQSGFTPLSLPSALGVLPGGGVLPLPSQLVDVQAGDGDVLALPPPLSLQDGITQLLIE